MKMRRLDATPYLCDGEVVQLKIQAKESKFNLIQSVICYLLWLVALAGDCFLIGMTNTLNQSLTNVNKLLLPMVIVLLVVHIVPFCFWLLYSMRSKQLGESKWYAVTNKRILIIAGTQPVNVTYVDLNAIDAFKINKNSIVISFGEERYTLGGLEDPKPIVEKLSQLFDSSKSNNGESETVAKEDCAETTGSVETAGKSEETLSEIGEE